MNENNLLRANQLEKQIQVGLASLSPLGFILSLKNNYLRKKRIIQLLFVFFLITFPLLSQDTGLEISIDSSLSVIRKADKMEKIRLLLEFSEYYRERLPDKSFEFSQEALKYSEEQGIPNYQADAYFSLGLGYYYKNMYDEALANFVMSLNLRQKIEDEAGIAICLNRIGNTYQLKRNFEKAIESYHEALKINKKNNDQKEIARTLTNMGSIHQLTGNYEQAIEFHLQSLKIHEETENIEGMAWAYLNIARLFQKIHDYEKALEYVNLSLQLYEDIAKYQGVKTGITLCLKDKSLIHYETGNYKEALRLSFQVLEINKETKNLFGISSSYTIIGKIYLKMGEYEKALENLTQSIELKNKIKDNIDLSSTYRYIGEIYLNKQQYTQAQEYFQQALDIARQQNLKEDIKDCYLSLSNIYSLNGKFDKSLDFYILYSGLKDSLNTRDIAQKELQYNFDKKHRQLELEQIKQNAKLERQRQLIVTFIIGIIIILVFAFFLYRSGQQKKRANIVLAQQKKLITDSIEYARRIQRAVLPQPKYLNAVLGDYFILYIPRDIVSGDFYWISRIENKTVIAIADCTGHGVPGAFMSMLGIAFLNEIVNKLNVLNTNEILYNLRNYIIDTLHQKDSEIETKDGMDIALCIIDHEQMTLDFSGAHNSLIFIRDGKLTELAADRMPIGIHINSSEPFAVSSIKLHKNDQIYMYSDGYYDQFGEKTGKKLKQKTFKDMLLANKDKPMEEMKICLEDFFLEWKGNRPQIDDILVFGMKV